LFSLSKALFHRSLKYGRVEDVVYCVQCLHYLRDQSLKAPGVTRNEVTALLIHVLALQVELEPGNVIHGVDEISVLCRALLSSDLPEPVLNDVFASFAQIVTNLLINAWKQPSQAIVNCLREAHMHLPDLHIISYVLFRYFVLRFYTTKSNDDYENAIAFLDKMLVPNSSTHRPNPFLGISLGIAAQLARNRFNFYGNPEYLEEAILRFRNILGSASLDYAERSATICTLEQLERTRFNELGVTAGLPEADPGKSVAVDLPSFPHVIAPFPESNAVEGPSRTVQDCIRHLNVVVSMDCITDKVNIEEAVKYCRRLLVWLQRSHDDVTIITHLTLIKTGKFLYHAFELTNNAEYLNESIGVYRDILKMPHAQWIHFEVVKCLISSLFFRYRLSEDERDMYEIFRLYPIAATNTYAKVPNRFEISCEWAQVARASGHPSTSDAYKSAISLMQDSLTFAPTLEMQHSRLVAMRDKIEKLPSDYASYQVRTGRLREAIETLEQGRGLLWSEMRGLRTSIDHLRMVDSCLAENFAAVNLDLEALTTSDSSMVWSNDGNVDDDEVMDPIGRVVLKQRELLDRRTSLITRIRSLPGFETFLTSLSFDTLRSAAAHGPVIIINHCEWQSDIIILLYYSPPYYLPTPDTFYDRARGLKEQLSAARQQGGLGSREYESALTLVLAMLYDLVGRPVLQKLHQLNVPEQSRIWWCPTSVFCSLPLHAMGPIRSDGSQKLYFSDLYIPSYTPTLSALIEARKSSPRSFEKPSILLIAQPDACMPGAWGEMSLIRRLKTTVTTLVSNKATPSAVMKRLQDHRFAHFACHGRLETGKPFDASFKLYNGKRLTLLDIIRSRLPSAEFAFLSACHTAELTDKSIADEGLHLSAAVQYSGFRSVVGTMWAMADIDGKVLAKNFYDSLFSERWEDVPYYERTAESLRDAVKDLRRNKKVTTERWVNFVHYGA